MSSLAKLLGVVSGKGGDKLSSQLLFDKVIGFRGVTPGCGTSTIVQNVAVAMSEQTNYSICVLDTSYMYPTQYPMLLSGVDERSSDFLDFENDISEIVMMTDIKNVSLVSLSNRGLPDMLSSKDSDVIVDKVLTALKSYFDIILIDLSYETTNIATYSAIKCNKVINIMDQSIKSVYFMRKSLNHMVSLAVPLAKADRVIINKVVPDIITSTSRTVREAGLKVLGEIPLSHEIAKSGVQGKPIYTSKPYNEDIMKFSSVILDIIMFVLQVTPLNEDNLSVNMAQKAVLKEKSEQESKLSAKRAGGKKSIFGLWGKNKDGKTVKGGSDAKKTEDDENEEDGVLGDLGGIFVDNIDGEKED